MTIDASAADLSAEKSGKASGNAAERVIVQGFRNGKAYGFEKELTQKFGGRPVGSRSLLNAEAWAAKQFRKMGLKVELQEVGRMPMEFVRGDASGTATIRNSGASESSSKAAAGDAQIPETSGAGSIDLHFVTPVYSAGTDGMVSGPVLLEPLNHYQLERVRDRLDGAWILVNGVSDGMAVFKERNRGQYRKALAYNDSLATVFNNGGRVGPAPQFRMLPALMYDELVAAGVRGFIQGGDVPLKCLMDRSRCFTLTPETVPTVCDIKLDRAQYRQIRMAVAKGDSVTCSFNIDNTFKPMAIPYSNVIARLEGTTNPDEYVIIGAHLDAFDVSQGAVDCGVGTSTVLEAARLLTSCRAMPERTILFCLWTGEEYGLLGSKYFVENPTVDLSKVSNYINRDGGSSAVVSVGALRENYNDMLEVCQPLLEPGKTSGMLPDGMPFALVRKAPFENSDPSIWPGVDAGTPINSDHRYFALSGIPCYSLAEGDPLRYGTKTDEWWHTETDDLSKVHPDYLQHNAVVSAVILLGIADLPSLLIR